MSWASGYTLNCTCDGCHINYEYNDESKRKVMAEARHDGWKFPKDSDDCWCILCVTEGRDKTGAVDEMQQFRHMLKHRDPRWPRDDKPKENPPDRSNPGADLQGADAAEAVRV